MVVVALCLTMSGCGDSSPSSDEIPDVEIPDEPTPTPTPDPVFEDEFVSGKLSIVTEGDAEILSKENYVKCVVSLTHDNAEWNLEEVSAGIRGRGNSTWKWYPKKPYRIKFDKKQKVMGLDAAKSWVLLAEYRDPTSLMNAFVFELGKLMKLPYTNSNRYVEVTLNDDYIGLYHLTEQVQQGSSRVNVDEENGYLIQLDSDDGPDLSPGATDNFWSEIYRMPVCVKNPDEPDATRLETVRKDLGELEKAIRNSEWGNVCSLLDIDSMIDFLIIQELVYNVELDAPRSMYMHKDVDGKWFMGPLWDFDGGFDFDWGTMYDGHNYFSNYRELVMGTNPATHAGTQYRIPGFFSDLFKMKEFVDRYKTRWEEVSLMVEPAWETTCKYYQANSEAFAREAGRWPIDKNYDREIGRLSTWLKNRCSYLSGVVKNY